MSKYTFQTVVVTEATRVAFSEKRDSLNASDKALFEAIWLTADWAAVEAKLAEIRGQFGRKKKEKAEPAVEETPIEKIARKAAKKKEKKEKATVVSESSDTEEAPLVVVSE